MALTRRQREIYDFIRDFVDAKGYSPSLEEIGEAFQLSSVATVHKHVQHLVEKGFLRKAWNRSRSVEPVEGAGSGVAALPLAGVVAAGLPIFGILVPFDWWRILAIASAVVSLLLVVIFWDPYLIVGLLIDAAVLVTLLFTK